MNSFLPGRELCRRFYEESVAPLLGQHFPTLSYAAGLIGSGSDVPGFDTAMSMDHDWGPRLLLFLRDEDEPFIPAIDQMFRSHLPYTFLDFPVSVRESSIEPGTLHMQLALEGPVHHRIIIQTLRHFLQSQLAYDRDQPVSAADWLTFPAQRLLSFTSGAVYHDGIGELTAFRKQFAWYPYDVWLYLLAAGWQRIGQEEHLMPRAGFVGDELGSALIGSRLVRDCMYLCFLMEKRYAPYPKWFGTAFKHLACAKTLEPLLWRTQQAPTWQKREEAFSEVCSHLARMHNALGITETLPETTSPFFDRPFHVIHGDIFAQALLKTMDDPALLHLKTQRLIGSIDQWSDSTDLREAVSWRQVLRKLYE